MQNAAEPRREHINELKIIQDEDITATSVPDYMKRVEEPGAGNPNFRGVEISAKELRKSSKGG
jgi:hypothetical protein